jgi:thiaminase
VVTHIIHEMNLHVEYCEAFGVSKEQILATEEDECEYPLFGHIFYASLMIYESLYCIYKVFNPQ